jgi:penicillin-binding protein 1C
MSPRSLSGCRSMRWRRLALAAALVWPSAGAQAFPAFEAVRLAHRPSDRTLLDRHGVPIQTLRVDDRVRRLPWVALADMSPALLQAVVLSEDRRFYEHSGVDWAAVARSAWANLWNTRTRGASTLTMQLAGLIDEGLARPAGGRGVAQKIDQAITATQLDAQWRKSEILEAYLNSVAFRGEVVGINALSQTLFGKHPSGLDAQEAALAAALVRGPNAAAETVAARACGVLRLQHLPCTGVVGLTLAALTRKGGMPLGEQLAPHLARQLLSEAGSPSLRSSIDAPVQRTAIAALRRQLTELAGRNVEDGAVLVLDNASGEVLAWVGSSGSLSAAAQVDGVLARRQPGSTLKPFVYGLAFERRLITPASLLDDSPAQIATSGGLYLPQNYDAGYQGWVSARTALGASLNIPAVRVASLLGPDAVHARLNQVGFDLPESAWHYGHSLALGGAEVTLLALTNAYRSLANGGLHSPVRLTPAERRSDLLAKLVDEGLGTAWEGSADKPLDKPADLRPRRVAEQAATFLVTDILADNNARVRTFGYDSSLTTRGFAAVKTGTSKDMRDNWCVGYTDRFTVGVWVGNASGEAMHDVSGISGAAPVWRTLVGYLHDGRPSRPPAAPPGVTRTKVSFDTGLEPARDEVFLVGTAAALQRAGTQISAERAFGITSPRDGSVFALDPDIPAQVQRIRLEGEAGDWWLDGKRIGSGSGLWWSPRPGRHHLSLRSRDGRVIQSLRIEVRAANVSSARSSK